MTRLIRKTRKALGALLGGATGAGVAAVIHHVAGIDVSPEIASAMAVLLAPIGAWLAPANETGEVS